MAPSPQPTSLPEPAATSAPRDSGPHRDPTGRTWWVAVVAVLVAVLATYGRARWPGVLPVGSDNDEYQLVGAAIARFEVPLVAGVEGTKYPLGYPMVLAVLEWLGLPPAAFALVINVAAMAATVAMVAMIAGRGGPGRASNPGAALAAGAVVATSVSVWNDVFSVMPELLLLVTVTGMLWVVARVDDVPVGDGVLGVVEDPDVVPGPATGRPEPWADAGSWRVPVILTVLGVVGVLLKTLAVFVVVGGAGIVWLTATLRWRVVVARRDGDAPRVRARPWIHPPSWRWLVPVAGAGATVLGGLLVFRDLPEHTTGYLATFPLVDPDDASQGRLGPWGLVVRTLRDVPDTLVDLGRAMALIDAGRSVAIAIAVVGIAVGIVAAHRLRRGGPLGPFVAGMSMAYAAGMAAWPYHSSRFGIPLVPVAALAAGWVVRLASRAEGAADALDDGAAVAVGEGAAVVMEESAGTARRGYLASMGFGVLIVLLLVSTSWAAVNDRGDSARAELPGHHDALAELARWTDRNLGDDSELVSFDYREIAHRLDRPVTPVSYTSDADDLLAQVAGADHLVVLDLYGKRTQQARILLDTHSDRFALRFNSEAVRVYEVRAPGDF